MRPRLALMVLPALLAACGAGGSTVSTPTPSPVGASGPPRGQATLTGDPSVTGPLTFTDITCNDPTFSGQQIVANATNAVAGLAIRLTVSTGSVEVMLDSGSGATYTERDFTGTGVANFNPATGVQINSPLTETTAAGGSKGTIAAITNVSASLSCDGQTQGSGTFTLSGSLNGGALSATLNVTRVVCTAPSTGVSDYAVGIGTEGSAPAIIHIFAVLYQGKSFMSMSVGVQGASTSSYLTAAPGTTTVNVTTASMQVSGRITEPYAPMDSVEVMGRATCGSSITPG